MTGADDYRATILDAADATSGRLLQELRADAHIQFVDTVQQQREELATLRPPRTPT